MPPYLSVIKIKCLATFDWAKWPNTLENGWPFGTFAQKMAKGQQAVIFTSAFVFASYRKELVIAVQKFLLKDQKGSRENNKTFERMVGGCTSINIHRKIILLQVLDRLPGEIDAVVSVTALCIVYLI